MSGQGPSDEVAARLAELAAVPVLLVASDYDGTLAPIVCHPDQARPERETSVAIRALAALAHTHVAVISGRALNDLARLADFPGEVHLVGSHGTEFDPDLSGTLSERHVMRRKRLREDLARIAAQEHGLFIEEKPVSIALHYRGVPPEIAERALGEVERGPARREGIFVRHGKKVIELSVMRTSKGRALETIRRRVGATAALVLGDDLTDEEAFATLSGADVGIKVGDGDTMARYRVGDSSDVARLLARLAELRTAWLEGARAVAIEKHSILSDQRSVAVVTPDARITWLCLPRLDSPALFAEMVGGPAAGRFTIGPCDGRAPLGQKYVENSMVLRTDWDGIAVHDFLDCSRERPRQRAGRSDLIRIVEGCGRVRVEFAPRLDFGRSPTRLSHHPSGVVVEGAFDPIVLRAPSVAWEIEEEGRHQTARADIELRGDPLVFDLRYGTASMTNARLLGRTRMDVTVEHWARWTAGLELPRVEPGLVARSALALRALCYGPSGAIAAAATTSLPEHLGGVRNWDYRYCWLRDGALAAAALVKLGSQSEALQFLDWVLRVVESCASPASLRPLYGLDGEFVAPDADIGELGGYRGSRPVRVGNSAAQQVQIDVFGPIVDLVYELLVREAPLSSRHWRLVQAMADAVETRWQDPDQGIWELRLPARHHVHSRTMCWVTLDRAVKVSRLLLERERPEWEALRDRIGADVLENGWSPRSLAFTTAYGFDDIDAAALAVGLSGLVDPSDSRFVRTVEAVERELLRGPVVYRYRFDDGLPGTEGAFLLCASWLVDAYLSIGRKADALALFHELTALAGPTGLLPEQYDPQRGVALGNLPQAYSHVGIIENAIRLSSGRPAAL
ncbi:MAG: trehalose-phosphatase [Deltaproteobacteria bacterium]|nr:trehalose-phosphatase [Deltaproteobacteria bacterium]